MGNARPLESMTPIRILIVASFGDEAGELLQVLRESGYDAFCKKVETVAALSEALASDTFDIALGFHHPSPSLSLFEAMAVLREQDCEIPFIAMGDTTREAEAMEMLGAGARDFLPRGQWARLALAVRRELDLAALRANERRLRSLVEGSNDGFWEWHISSGQFQFTPRWAEMLGYAPGEIEQNISSWKWLVHPDDWDAVWQKMQGHIAGRWSTFESEHRMRTQTGDWCWIFCRGKVVARDANGSPLRVAGSQTDNTERRTAEEELWQRQAELSAIYNHAPMMLLLLDDDNRVRRFNQAVQEFTGARAGRIAEKRIGEVIGCANFGMLPGECGNHEVCKLCPLNLAIQDCRSKSVQIRRHEIRLSIRRTQGIQEVVLLVSVARLRLAEQGALFICLEDITSHKRADERIREQAALLDIARDAIYVHDLSGRMVYWNRSAENLFGWALEETLGQSVEFLLFAPGSNQWTEARRQVLEREEWSGEMSMLRRNQSAVIVQSHWTLVRDQAGNPKSVLVVSVDLTERKKLEVHLQRTQRLESIGLLAGGIAHDLNNALGPIIMGLQLLKDRLTEPELLSILETMQISAQRGANIVKQVHTFARGTPVAVTWVAISRFLEDFLQNLRRQKPPQVAIQADISSDLPEIPGDEIQLHQALSILCGNAFDAMKSGGTLTLIASPITFDAKTAYAVPGARPGSFIKVMVSDTGFGMPPEVLDKVFDPFYTTKDVGQGVGLGLATALGIVKGHGGFMQADSQSGQGSQFSFYLPLKLVTA